MGSIKEKISSIRKSKDARAVAGNFMWLSVLKVIGYVFPLITMPYLARVIGVAGFGEIAFAVSIMVFFETFTDFGFNYTATRDVARCRDDHSEVSRIFSNVFWAKILLMIVAFAVLSILVFTIPSLYDKRLLLFLTFLYIPGHILFPDWFFQAMEDMKYITILNVISKAIFTALIFVVIKEQSDYVWQPLLNAIGYWLSGAIAMWFITKKFQVEIFSPNFKDIWNSIKGGWNMFLSLLLPNLYTNFSTILLRSYCGDVATGLYDAGAKFINIINYMFDVLSRAFYPFLSRRIDKHKIYVFINGMGSLLASFLLFFSADLLIKIFYTPEFTDAAIVTRILSISPIALFLMNTYGTNFLIIKNKENVYRNITITFSIIGLVFALIFVPKYSYMGMAATITSARIIGGVLTYIYAYVIKNRKGNA